MTNFKVAVTRFGYFKVTIIKQYTKNIERKLFYT